MKNKILVLMATHNGEKYIYEQLKSIFFQKNVCLDILISDDSSSDNTIKIIETFVKENNANNIKIIKSKCGTAQKNFYTLINQASLDYDYYALSDQDDYWIEDKLYNAINKMKEFSDDKPVLYSSESILVNKNLEKINKNKKHYLVDKLPSSLVACNTQGCTMVFNNIFLKFIKNKLTKTDIMHDAWLHRTCLVLNGNICFDSSAYLLYRQHENNVVACKGKKENILKKIIYKVITLFSFKNKFLCTDLIKEWKINFNDIISEETVNIFDLLVKSHESFLVRIRILFDNRFKTKYKYQWINFMWLVLNGKI